MKSRTITSVLQSRIARRKNLINNFEIFIMDLKANKMKLSKNNYLSQLLHYKDQRKIAGEDQRLDKGLLSTLYFYERELSRYEVALEDWYTLKFSKTISHE